MNAKQTMHFIKLWRKIEKAQQELDFRKSEWSRDVRKLSKSDADFIRWCDVELKMARNTAEEMLRRAKLVAVVSDAQTWNKLGGYDKMQPLVMHNLSRKEQIAIVEAAKVSGYAPKTGPITKIMQQLGHLPKSAPTSHSFSLPVIATPTADEIRRLAEFIDETYKNPPDDIRRIISKYTISKCAVQMQHNAKPITRLKQTVEISS